LYAFEEGKLYVEAVRTGVQWQFDSKGFSHRGNRIGLMHKGPECRFTQDDRE